MDVPIYKLSLFPDTQNCLFRNYRELRLIFQDVLGHFEIDYISIAMLNEANQLLFLSSRPAIEHNIITQQLWQLDPCLQNHVFTDHKIYLWHEYYQDPHFFRLNYYKLRLPGFVYGFSIPHYYGQLKTIYSFALASNDVADHEHILTEQDQLKSIGRFCLQNSMDFIPESYQTLMKPNLKLIQTPNFL